MRIKYSAGTVTDFGFPRTSGYRVLAVLMGLKLGKHKNNKRSMTALTSDTSGYAEGTTICPDIEPLVENNPDHLVKLRLWTASVLAKLNPNGNPDASGQVGHDYDTKLDELVREIPNKNALNKSSYTAEEFNQMFIALTCTYLLLLHLSIYVDINIMVLSEHFRL